MHLFPKLCGAELLAPQSPVGWLWEGILAEGNVTLLTSLWKAGKSTLLSHLLAHRCQGGLLLDRIVETGASAVVSEEPQDIWSRRARKLNFGPNIILYCRPFKSTPDHTQWSALIDQLVDDRARHGVNLVAFDPLIHVLPCSENNSTALRDALEPLRRLTDCGVAVLLLHHPPKEGAVLGKASRGNGALPAFADILLELRMPAGNPATHQRWLHGFSRHEETPRQLLTEMHVTGMGYRVLRDEEVCDDFRAHWATVAAVLAQAGQPLTRHELLALWPVDHNAPHAATLWRWLRRASDLGLATVSGSGSKGDPCRFELRVQEGQRAG